jgi:hypothetical protein
MTPPEDSDTAEIYVEVRLNICYVFTVEANPLTDFCALCVDVCAGKQENGGWIRALVQTRQ